MINRGGQTVKRNLEKGVDILEYLNIIILENDDEVSDMSDPTALYEEKAELLKALAHPLRLRIVRGLLKCGCRNVGCMEANTGQSQSCISQHLQKLRAANVVTAERSGNEVYYQVASREVASLVADLLGEEADSYVL